MMLMKACPRCNGDLVLMRDPSDDEPTLSCMQCGYVGYRRVLNLEQVEVAATSSERERAA